MNTLPQFKGVEFVREELRRVAPDYQLLADCIEGERAIKGMIDNDVSSHLGFGIFSNRVGLYRDGNVIYSSAARRYLPKPLALDTSEENAARYDAYVTRAVFYNATARTLDGYAGLLFQRPPVIELPPDLDVVAADATGERTDLAQVMKEAVSYVLPYGRAGFLADYPTVSGGLTAAQVKTGFMQPVVRAYAPWNITNWRERQIGSARVLELVVLREPYTIIGDDGFETEMRWQYRVLNLDQNSQYGVTLYRREGDTHTGEYRVYRGRIIPKDADGLPFDRIPFFFAGSQNNDPKIDRPPFLDIAKVNVGHYRNSADYEESCFMVGQPTPVFMGLTEEWYREVLQGQILLGSRGSIALPEGADAKLLQPEPNTMPYEAMQHKEKQLVTLGARIAETPDVMRTATEATLTAVEASSPLLSTALNVSIACKHALEVCARFVGADDSAIKVNIMTEASLQLLNAPERQQMREDFVAGLLTFEEVRENLRRAGVAGASTDEEARVQLEEARKRNEPVKETNNETSE